VGEFDLPLARTGTPTVEPRVSGGNHTIVFTFANQLSSVGSASVTGGTAQVSSAGIDPANSSRYIVNLTNAPDGQRLTISLSNVSDVAGNQSSKVPLVMDVLAGDLNGDTSVNIGDTLQTRSRVGQTADATNFRFDVNRDGTINAGDAIFVRGRAGSSITP
jgi:hypothetical protein